MKTHSKSPLGNLFAAALLLGALATATAQTTTTQTFQLRNGWNSIWLEVEPTNKEIAAVFANLPISSVWTYVAKDSPVQFMQNQTEDRFNEPAWLHYFPPNKPESFLNNLFTVNALRAYLIKLTNGPMTLTVTGRPVVRTLAWVPNSFNLRGFPVNPAMLPSFATFFGPSPAHVDQPIYQLGNDGQWHAVAPTDIMKHGEAYWTFASGASTYQGPLGFELSPGDGLDFGVALLELVPRLLNNSPENRTICMRDLVTGANNPLSYQGFFSNRLNWVNLPAPHCFSLSRQSELDFRLAMRRIAFAGNTYGSILEVKDDIGTRYLLAVSAEKLLAARASLADSPAMAGTNSALLGLWIGTASVTNVNEANSSQPTHLTPTRSPFDLRLLVHVTTNSQGRLEGRLLKEVIQMWQNGTSTNDMLGRAVVDKPGRFVLLTDDSLIPEFRGASLRDGVPVGRRFSTVDFDFAGGRSNVLAMTGEFFHAKTNSCTLVLEPNHPTNPFKHRYHPDHDNLDASYQHAKEEAYRITRKLNFEFTPTDPNPNSGTLDSLEYGHSILGGIYRETVTGLHRTNIMASGTFRLTRVSNSPLLNQ